MKENRPVMPGSKGARLVPVKELSLSESTDPREMLLTVDTGEYFPNTEIMIQRDFLPLGKFGIVTGTGGTGKTHLLTQLAISVATGEKWLGHFNVTNPGKVVLLLGEEGIVEVKRRLLKAINKKYQFSDGKFLSRLSENLIIMPIRGVDTRITDEGFNDTNFMHYLKSELAGKDLKLIIMDPAIQFMPLGAENNAVVSTLFAKKLNQLIAETGNPTLIITHHNNYRELVAERRQNGAQGLFDAARWVVNLELIPFRRDPAAVRLPWVVDHYPQFVAFRHVKSTYTKLMEYCILRRDEHGFLVFDKGAMEQIRHDYQQRER